MERLIQAIHAVFTDHSGPVTGDMQLVDIAGWDSMNAVNLQMELEFAFDVDLGGVLLHGKLSVAEVEGIVKARQG